MSPVLLLYTNESAALNLVIVTEKKSMNRLNHGKTNNPPLVDFVVNFLLKS